MLDVLIEDIVNFGGSFKDRIVFRGVLYGEEVVKRFYIVC